jgi:hypothetical protein
MTAHALLAVAAYTLAGFAVGLGQLASLRRNVRLYASPASRVRALAFHALRAACLVIVWVLLARFGRAAGILGGFGGFLAVRPVFALWSRRTSP